MRILFTIPHFYQPKDNAAHHASQRKNPQPRIQALSECITSLHQVFGKSQYSLDLRRIQATPAHEDQACDIDVVVCTTGDHHLLDRLDIPQNLYIHHPTKAESLLLGFECQAVLRDSLGQYDYYCYLEDDLIVRDPWFFQKLRWFNNKAGEKALLQPNRYEIAPDREAMKLYIDGDLRPELTNKFQNVQQMPELKGWIMETPVLFRRTFNPHAGCYFLNRNQMIYWSRQPHFLDRDTSFIGPLESAATLGIMRTFRIYKPTTSNAGFLEVQHSGQGFLNLIGKQVKLARNNQ